MDVPTASRFPSDYQVNEHHRDSALFASPLAVGPLTQSPAGMPVPGEASRWATYLGPYTPIDHAQAVFTSYPTASGSQMVDEYSYRATGLPTDAAVPVQSVGIPLADLSMVSASSTWDESRALLSFSERPGDAGFHAHGLQSRRPVPIVPKLPDKPTQARDRMHCIGKGSRRKFDAAGRKKVNSIRNAGACLRCKRYKLSVSSCGRDKSP